MKKSERKEGRKAMRKVCAYSFWVGFSGPMVAMGARAYRKLRGA